MAIANDTVVSIEYEVKEADSKELVDSNKGGDPLEFLLGRGQIIPGLEEAIAQMSKGESKTLRIPAEKAYGAHDAGAVQPHEKEQFAGIELSVGMTLYGQSDNGQTVQVTVKEITEEQVFIDYNHPLAGKDLEFDVTVVDTRDATEKEKRTGMVESECCGTGQGGCGCGH
ncbi:MAG: peptidylprolyl isomerase [Campylobacterales bacterium]